ncbi:radial spoke head protein 3 homolog isoform X1 [Apteryx mantelli]|uniref:Radial spoke head protein 3 homolog isoform X1 n=1 Tax=Apteryx mantelli TaxID=2696672 RepID=A0ABM4EAN2_9AVES
MLSARLMGRRHSEPHLSFRNHWEGSVRHQKLTKELHSEELSDQVTELQVESQESELLDSSPSLLSFDTAIDRDVAAQAGQGEECCQHQQVQAQQEQETTKKTASQVFAECYLADPTPSVWSNLDERGDFCDSAERDIETEFLPWWMVEVEEAMEKTVLGRTVLDCSLSK